jgi:hypothetical protein
MTVRDYTANGLKGKLRHNHHTCEGASMDKRKSPIVVSFYTKHTPYEKEVENLISSLERWEIKYDVRGLSAGANWQVNCNMKATFCRDLMAERERSIIWLDADAVVERYPSLFWKLDQHYDFAICPKGPRLETKFLSGTLWFNYTDASRRLLDAWVRACEKPRHQWSGKERNTPDQVFLHTAWRHVNAVPSPHPLRTFWLPQSYCAIFDKPLLENEPPVIIHYQASGRFKHIVGAGD